MLVEAVKKSKTSLSLSSRKATPVKCYLYSKNPGRYEAGLRQISSPCQFLKYLEKWTNLSFLKGKQVHSQSRLYICVCVYICMSIYSLDYEYILYIYTYIIQTTVFLQEVLLNLKTKKKVLVCLKTWKRLCCCNSYSLYLFIHKCQAQGPEFKIILSVSEGFNQTLVLRSCYILFRASNSWILFCGVRGPKWGR